MSPKSENSSNQRPTGPAVPMLRFKSRVPATNGSCQMVSSATPSFISPESASIDISTNLVSDHLLSSIGLSASSRERRWEVRFEDTIMSEPIGDNQTSKSSDPSFERPAQMVQTKQNAWTAAIEVRVQPSPILNSTATSSTNIDSNFAVADRKHFTSKRFAEAPISERSKAGIRHKFLMDVQDARREHVLSGIDLLVQAKPGTGKTMAFLLPAIERLVSSRSTPSNVGEILVLAPTWELALQIEEEAKSLLVHHPMYSAQSVIGGTNINTEKTRLSSPTARHGILVATPGRLLDHLTSGLTLRPSLLVLDEADRLLDQGFRKDLERIIGFLPEKLGTTRQCMLFSATFDKSIQVIAKLYLDPNYKFISTLHEDEINTHEHVPQSYLITPLEQTLPTLVSLLKHLGPRAKIMLFCTTARGTAVVASVLQQVSASEAGPRLPSIHQIHSDMPQSARACASQIFRDALKGMVVTSDVTARGMDFPGVTHIIQLSLPTSPAQYIHRLGRTARAGAGSEGILILMPNEEFFLELPEIASLPLTPYTKPEHVGELKFELKLRVIRQAYEAWLGFYEPWLWCLRWTPVKLVEQGAVWARCLGWRGVAESRRGSGTPGIGRVQNGGTEDNDKVLSWTPPPIAMCSVEKMGLKGTPGLNVVDRVR
ncbi:DEAD-domain-containing protein [Rhizopogon vinicolor AM-OR11-026]|uniref:ATP-dependent RNA helicase n=1 Tax=Rhizopogon vinicolor AM-OR11-026 TaxID=1314800 RepID=A0A1B7MX60_9AGAM|nr:DEAD-domain-containing protein [Rhizopogon vinicolor AM-OR11-026]